MTYRVQMPARPWLDGAAYDKYNTPNVVHFDLYAWSDEHGDTYFEIEVRARGKTLIAWSMWRVEPVFGVWRDVAHHERPDGLTPLRWSRATHDRFRHVHGRLLALCVTPRGYTARTVHCHYVKPYDGDPWPRGFLNTWSAPTYSEGKRPGRPRNPRVTPEAQSQINILMGVDVLDII